MSNRKITLTAEIDDEPTPSMLRCRAVSIDVTPLLEGGEWELDIPGPVIHVEADEITIMLHAAEDDEDLWEDELDDRPLVPLLCKGCGVQMTIEGVPVVDKDPERGALCGSCAQAEGLF
jgi:hypothetical protein